MYALAVPEKSGKVSPAILALILSGRTLSGLTHPVSMVPHVCGLVAVPPQALPPSSLAPALLCESLFHGSREDMSVGIGPIRQCKVFQGEIALTDSECWDTGTKFSGSTLIPPLFFLCQLHKPGWNFSSENFIDAFWLSDLFILISNILIFNILQCLNYRPLSCFKKRPKPATAPHTCNPSTREAKAG